MSGQSKVIILGTIPGGKSLALNEYYADSSNKLWQIMEAVFSINASDTYLNRINSLKFKRVALWDVLQSCERLGSLDENITNPYPNELASFFASNPTIKAVFFNGQKAKRFYESLVFPTFTKT